jgi:preprotein translocase subunit Sss1
MSMDQIQQFTEPCKQFMKDSFRLVKKCTKPDRKGNGYIYIVFLICIFSLIRISEDRYGNSNWFCHYGIYWFLC